MQWFYMFIAKFLLARQKLIGRLVERAQRTPYTHITSFDGKSVYMYRWWLFNQYDPKTKKLKWPWLPVSIRIHRIMRPDNDRHLHDHPWNARTIILRGFYIEERINKAWRPSTPNLPINPPTQHTVRYAGSTSAIRYGEYHRIRHVPIGGAWTLFITFRYRGVWGFLVDGKKVPHYEYRKLYGEQ